MLKILLMLTICFSSLSTTPVLARASNGSMDLESRPIEKLNGEWLFFPETFLSLEDFKNDRYLSYEHKIVNIPGALTVNEGEATWGSVVLKLENVAAYPGARGLKLRADTAYEFYWLSEDDNAWQTVVTAGKPGTNKQETMPLISDAIGRFYIEKPGTHFLVGHISGFHYTQASIWTSPEIYSYPNMERNVGFQRLAEAFVSGMIFIMSVYYLSMYYHRREDKTSIWLAMFTFLNFLRISATSGSLGSVIFNDASPLIYEIIRKLEFGILMPIGSTGLMFSIKSLGYKRLERFSWANVFLSIAAVIFCTLTTAEVYPKFLLIMNLHLFSCIIFTLILSYKALFNSRTGSRELSIGVSIVTLAVVFDMAVGFGAIASPIFIGPFGFTALIFCQGQVISALFANAFRTAQRLTRTLKDEVELQTAEIRTMLDSIPQGILNIDSQGKIDKNHSKHLEKILEQNDFENEFFSKIIVDHSDLNEDLKDQLNTALFSMLGESSFNFEANFDLLPNEIRLNTKDQQKIVQLTWSPILDKNDEIIKILVTLYDVTKIREFEEKSKKQQKDMEFIQEILAISEDKFLRFIEDSRNIVHSSKKLLEGSVGLEEVQSLFVNMHTIKGAARTLGFKNLTTTLHEIENYYSQILNTKQADFDIGKMQEDLQFALKSIEKYDNLNKEVLKRNTPDKYPALIREHLAQLEAFSNQHLSNKQRMELEGICRKLKFLDFPSLSEILRAVKNDLDQVSKDLKKQAPQLRLQGDLDIYLHPTAVKFLNNCFTHIVRNILDHGIESPDERRALLKDPSGIIHIEVIQTATHLDLRINDDGRGLALEKIREKVIEKRLVKEIPTSKQQLANLIFLHGFSTADTISEFSGRGVGMSALKEFAGNLTQTRIELELGKEKNPGFYDFDLIISLDLSYTLQQKNKKAG